MKPPNKEPRLTQEINRARQFAGEALEHVPVAFCTLDRNYRITYMNAAALNLPQLSGKPHMGAHPVGFVSRPDRKRS